MEILLKQHLDVLQFRYYTIKGKLTGAFGVCTGVHPGLRAIGVKRIEINCRNEEVAFIFEGNAIIEYKQLQI